MALLVNGEKIEDRMIQREVERIRPEYEKVFSDQPAKQREEQLLEWSRENVIEAVLLRQEAERTSQITEGELEELLARTKKSYDNDSQFYAEFNAETEEEARKRFQSSAKLHRLFEDIRQAVREPSNEAVLKHYEQSREQFETPETVRAAHIVKHVGWRTDETAACEAIKQAYDELQNGAVFEMLVEKYSDCPDNGGDLGYITRGEMVEEFDDAVFNLGAGQVSSIFRTRFGFHIAKVYDRKPASVPPLKQVRHLVVGDLKEKMHEQAIEKLVDELRSKAVIEEVQAGEQDSFLE